MIIYFLMEHILLPFCKIHGLSQKFPNILHCTILVSWSIRTFIKLCVLFALKWNTNLFYSLCNSWLNNVEVLRDRPGRQMPVNLDCGRQRFGCQWMDDRRGIGKDSYLRNGSAQTNAGKCQRLWPSPHTRTYLTLSIAFIPFGKKKMCQKCTFWSFIFNE